MTNVNYFSQFGEDRLLHDLFKGKPKGCCVEVGGNDGILNSNSCHFEELGWKTLLVEPIPALCSAIRSRRPAATVVECAASDRDGTCDFHIAVGVDGMSTMSDDISQLRKIEHEGGRIETITVKTRTLDGILADAGIGEIDFMTIDVEGAEKQVLAGLSLAKWRPRILIIEDNSQGWDKWLCGYLQERGYVNFHRTGVNDWFAAAGDDEILGHYDMARFRRMRSWLPWRHWIGQAARRIMPANVRKKLKRWFGELPFSASDGK